MRQKDQRCKASVIQPDSAFFPGIHDHNHPGKFGVLAWTHIQACVNTAKKVAFTRLENDRLTLQNAAFCLHSLTFSNRKIRGFLFFFLMVNLSFRSIIQQFSTGVHRRVDALKTDSFPLCCRYFPVTKHRVNWCLLEFSLIYFMFTAWVTHGTQVVFWCFPVTKQ